MATFKHISSKNADYGAAEQYLTFEHDEFTMKPTLDGNGQIIPRTGYLISSLNCGDEDFAIACMRSNLKYGKNQKREDVKSHHYIISFAPRDAADNGLSVDRAQQLGEQFCKEHFPGHQALVCTHPDGHNHSGNIHVHIVINSLRIEEVPLLPYMERPTDTREGCKHRCTDAAMEYFKAEVMEMCHRENLYQIDLLNGSKNRVTEREYWAKRKGQAALDKENASLAATGEPPKVTKFETDKEKLRRTIRAALSSAISFEDFSGKLLQQGVTVKESRGRLSYLTPDRTKPITARKLGDDFDRAAVLEALTLNAQNAARATETPAPKQEYPRSIKDRLQRNKAAINAPKNDGVQRMVDIAAKKAEGKGKGYEKWATLHNLKQMAATMSIYEESGFSSPEELEAALAAASAGLHEVTLLVSNTDHSEYDLLNVKGMERTEIFNLLSTMKDDDRQNVEAYLERAGAWVTLLANERSEEVEEYHLDYAYDTDTHEITDYKALQEERERANVPIEYGDVIVRISTPDSGEYETIKIVDMQSEVANVLYAIPFLEENEWNGNVLDYLQERGLEFVPIMRSGGLNDGYPQFYDFDVDMSEWEVHTASELPATVQAEQLINRMEFHRSVYDSDERNLIMNHAYKLDDMYKTTSLAHSLAEQKDDLALLWETIRVAEEEIDALPDGMVGLSQMHEYGYSWDEMLPLTKDRATELFREDVSVYQLHADGSETLVEDRAALQGHDGLFGVEKGDWNAYKEYQSMTQELEDSEPNREAQLLYGNEGRYGIYQLKDSAETRDIRFMGMDYLEKEGIPVSRENYTLVYTGELTEGMSLEDIYTKFNIDHPADFTGHSLSVSDVVVLHQDGENTSHYVDSVGYREIPEFTKELSVSAEISTEKDAVREETAEIPAEAAAENTMAEPDNDKVSYYVIEDLSTWAENSPEKSRLERFESLPEAMAKFTEYRGKETEDKPDMARATLGFSVNGSEFDLIHVRNHENCLSLDFTHSRTAVESSRFMEDLQTLNHEVGFDKVRVHREMSPEEIKDFVKRRFEYQLKSSGLDDISLYMDRFDSLYEQGKMEHLMPTTNQKHIVEDVPFTEWENPYIDTKSQTMGREETELAFRLADRYISIQEATEGYDYTIYDMDYRELDGGVYDNPDITIRQALDEIVTDLKEPMHRSELEGNIHTYDELIPIDYDELTEKAEQEAKYGIENRIRKEAEERKTVADFKARTEELFHGINGQTQEDIELSVYAYLQSKIDEYEINIELVDVAVSGSRCRGLEEAASDLDVVVEYRGRESEDDLFNAFNEDGFTIGGVKVDINPITEGKTGTLGEYLPGVEAYLAEKRAALQEKAAEQAQEEKQTVVTLTVAECGEFHNFGEYHEGIADVPEAIAIFNRIPPERMNGIPSIGINIHTEGTESYEDTQMDIVSGRVADLEILDYVPDITDNPKAVEVIAELIDKLPDIEVRGSLEKWQAAFLAAEIDQLSYNYDTVQYNQTVEDREAQIANITEDIRNGNTGYLNDFLNALISDSIREGMTDIIGKGTELDDSEGVQTARKAKELLDKLAEYKPLAKIEELEECNYNMIDNVLNNEKPKEEKQAGRISIKEKLAEKKAVIEQRDKSDKEVPEKGTEKKSEREI